MTIQHKTRALLLTLGLTAMSYTSGAFASKDVVVAVYANFTTLDPYNANDTLSQGIAKSFYQGLFGFDRHMKLIPVLAESYSVSDHGRVYTIKLRQGVKFQDGTDFNAAAVKANFDRARNPANRLKRYNLYQDITNIDVINPYTVSITLKSPFSAFINVLAHPSSAMISPAALEKYGNDIGFHPVGTGPYQFEQWNSTDFVKVKKYHDYWQQGLPKLDSITWRPVPDNNTRSAMLKTGEAQFAYPIPYEQAQLIKNNPKLTLVAAPSIVLDYLSINVTQKPFDNPLVRQAISYAINREALLKVVYSGYADPATGVAPPDIQYAKKFPPMPYNPSKARELLKQAGYASGFSTTLWAGQNHSTAQKMLQFLQQQLAQVGIKTQVRALDSAQRVSEVESKGQQESLVRLFYGSWSASTGEANWALTPLFSKAGWPPALYNTAFYSNPRVDQYFSRALRTNDEQQKTDNYAKAQTLIWQDIPAVPLDVRQVVYAHDNQLTGFYVMPDGMFGFEQANLP